MGGDFKVLGEFSLLVLLGGDDVASEFLVESLEIVKVSFEADDGLSGVSQQVLRVFDGFSLVSDFESGVIGLLV